MTTKTTIDKAGRVIIPKPLRDALQLNAGDALQIESQEDQITLKPVRDTIPLQKELGVWIYRSGQPVIGVSIPDLIDQIRDERAKELKG